MTTFDRERKINNAKDRRKVIRTAAYIRVSTDEQAKHGFSIDAQKEGLQKYADEHGYKIVDWYIDDGKSARGKTIKRKEYLRLIEDAKQGKFEMVIFKCLDRWFRNISEYYKTQSVLDDQGINWECAEEDFDTTTRDGRWKLHIYLMLAQDESDKTSERINYVFEHKVKNKEAITGHQPFGFVVKEIDGHKRVVKDKSVEHVILDIFDYFELYNSKRATLNYIYDKYGINFDYKIIGNILTNTYYYGHYRGVDDYIWDGSYITKERHEKIKQMVKKNVKERKNNIEYIFSGLLKCSCCNNNLSGGSRAGHLMNGEQIRYKSYRCNYAMHRHGCIARGSIQEPKLERMLIQSIENEIEDYICHYELELKKKIYKPKDDIKSIREEMDRLNKQWRKNRISEKEYDYEYERLEKKIEKIQQENPKEKDLAPLYDFMNSGWENIYDTLNDVEKRALWRSVIDYMIVDIPTKTFEICFI